MDQMQVIATLAMVTTAIVGALKKAWPTWMSGKEELFAMVVPIIVVPILKITHVTNADMTWANVVVTILVTGLGAGVFHDKVVNPLMAGKKTGEEPK